MTPYLLLPVENQVRELDAKLLVALLAAQSGFRAVIGWKGLLDFRVGRFPPSLYVAKSMSQQNTKMLRIKKRLGHYVLAWDEEAVVHYPKDIYYARRIGKDALPLVNHIVAWGEDNRELLLGHPLSDDRKITVLGNPRADLLRPELEGLFRDRVNELRAAHGEFILVNTNFGSVNGYTDTLNLMRKDPETNEWVAGRGSSGMPRDYAEGLFAHRRNVFEQFQTLLPAIAAAFPNRKVILRPHPAEDHEFWRELLRAHSNVEVLAQGNVVPWLKAAGCLVHNGCTTAVEGFLMGTPIVSFVPKPSERFDFHLPNKLGKVANSASEVVAAIHDPKPTPEFVREQEQLVGHYIHRTDEELAAERIVDLLPRLVEAGRELSGNALTRTLGRIISEGRTVVKQAKRRLGVARYSEAFMRQRFPELTLEEVQTKVDALKRMTDERLAERGAVRSVKVIQRERDLFELRAE